MTACPDCGAPRRRVTRYEGSIPYVAWVCDSDACPSNIAASRSHENAQLLSSAMLLLFVVILAALAYALVAADRENCTSRGGRIAYVHGGYGGWICEGARP